MTTMDEWLTHLIDFLSINTSNPPGRNYGKAIKFLAPLCLKAGLEIETVRIPKEIIPGRTNLLAHRRSPGKPRLLAYSHIDVVPADEGWKPFEPRIKEGRIFGRGVADMKGCIIAFLAAAHAVKDQPWSWDATLMVTTDEETNQKAQLEYLMRERIDGLRGATLLDLDSAFGYVSIGGLGHVAADVTTHGVSVHSGISHTGINAIEKATAILNALMELKKKVESRFSKVPTNPEIGIKTMQSKLNINVIEGGLKRNIVPDGCRIEIDRRLVPEETIEDARRELEETLAPLKKDIDFTLEFIHATPGYGAVSESAEKMGRCLEKVTGSGKLYAIMGSGDLLATVAEHGWQVVGCGVGRERESNFHGRDENARIEDIKAMSKAIELFLTT
jgi:succinyl-diaminopimelate desuccinylase